MTKFEQVAINIQYQAYDKKWAVKQFANTCHLCCLKGRHVDCDKCNIASTHQLVIALLDEQEQKRK